MNVSRNLAAKYGPKLALVGAAVMPMLSHAALDTTAATAAISDAQTALLAIVAGVTTLVIAIWGATKVYRFFGKK